MKILTNYTQIAFYDQEAIILLGLVLILSGIPNEKQFKLI